jgi:hypothetical protein
MKNCVAVIIQNLKNLLAQPTEISARVDEIRKAIWECDDASNDLWELELLRDLANDLDYYDSDPRRREKEGWWLNEEDVVRLCDQCITKLEKKKNV